MGNPEESRGFLSQNSSEALTSFQKVAPDIREEYLTNLHIKGRGMLLRELTKTGVDSSQTYSAITRALLNLPEIERIDNFYELGPKQQVAILMEISSPVLPTTEEVIDEAPAPKPVFLENYERYSVKWGDPYEYYRRYLSNETRGAVQNLDPTLWEALKRKNYADRIPYYEPYGSDPLAYTRSHYPHLSVGQLAQVNSPLYQYLYRRNLHTELDKHRPGDVQYRADQEGVRRPYWGREAKAWAILATAIERRVSMDRVIDLFNKEGFSSLRDKPITRDILFEDLKRFGVKIMSPVEALEAAQERVHTYGDITAITYAKIERELAQGEEGIRWDLHPVPWMILRHVYQARLEKGAKVRRGIVDLDTIARALSRRGFVPVKGKVLEGHILEKALKSRFGKLSLPETHKAIVTFADAQQQWLTPEDTSMVREFMYEIFKVGPDPAKPLPAPIEQEVGVIEPVQMPIKEEARTILHKYRFSFPLSPDQMYVYYVDGRKTASTLTETEYIQIYEARQFEWQQRNTQPPYFYPELIKIKKS